MELAKCEKLILLAIEDKIVKLRNRKRNFHFASASAILLDLYFHIKVTSEISKDYD